jgi:uncharacterized protein (TIGR02996 family)
MPPDLRRAFLEDIVEHPDEDTPRLIFADWLEEQGEEAWAQLIRQQIRTPQHESVWVLLQIHSEIFTTPWVGLAKEILLERGFVEGVIVAGEQMAAFVEALPQLCQVHPLRRVRLEFPRSEDLEAVVTHMVAERFRPIALDLNLRSDTTPEPWLALLRSHACGERLRSLLIEHEQGDPAWNQAIEFLDGAGSLNHLTELGLGFGTHGDSLSPAILDRIVGSPWLAQLSRLHVPFTTLSNHAMEVLGDSPLRARLTHLDLGCCHIRQAGWELLVSGSNTQRLQWLGLIGAHVLDDTSTGWESLRDHHYGNQLANLLGDRADFVTSTTFPRWRGLVVPEPDLR